ncbi:MAG: SoxR reducing system RseC family protein [Bacteroidales bacterium]|nr:SoxR reducing system RseC family protein [Bacteroidales bacterium]
MEHVDHDGIVKEINGNEIKVSIISIAACASCAIQNVCNPSDAKEKIFSIRSKNANEFNIGEKVKLTVSAGKGLLAVFLSYILPVIIIFAFIIVALTLGMGEGISALVALGATAIYFLIIFLTRKKAAESFNFSIHKQ